MSDALIVAIAGGLIQTGILLATVRYLGLQLKDMRGDINGVGRKMRSISAEVIIQAKEDPEFAVIVRKIVNGI